MVLIRGLVLATLAAADRVVLDATVSVHVDAAGTTTIRTQPVGGGRCVSHITVWHPFF